MTPIERRRTAVVLAGAAAGRVVARAAVLSLAMVLSLATALSIVVAGRSVAAEKIVVDGSTGVMPLVEALAKAYQTRHPDVAIEMGKGLGTKARLQALSDGKIDIALASHGLAMDELARQGMTAHEIAKIAVVFGVNASVPVKGITDQQVCDVYAGRVTSWSAVGGPELPIAPRTRPDTEVDAEVVRAKIGCLKDLAMPEAVKVMPRSGDMARELATVPGAIGMTTMTVVERSQGRIKALALNGIEATAQNVTNKTYRLTRDSFLVTRSSPSPEVAKFLDYVRSAAGADAVAANGAVPVK